MTQRSLTYFTLDRFCAENSSLALNNGWTEIPPGVYFDTKEFTISVWVLPQQLGKGSRVIDLGSGQGLDNIVFGLQKDFSLQPYVEIYSGYGFLMSLVSSQQLTLNEWQLLTATYDGHSLRIYLNGLLTAISNYTYDLSTMPKHRTNCYIGQSNWVPCCADGYSNSYLDDLRFYNKSLTQEEIINDLMNVNQSQISNLFSYELLCLVKKIPYFYIKLKLAM